MKTEQTNRILRGIGIITIIIIMLGLVGCLPSKIELAQQNLISKIDVKLQIYDGLIKSYRDNGEYALAKKLLSHSMMLITLKSLVADLSIYTDKERTLQIFAEEYNGIMMLRD